MLINSNLTISYDTNDPLGDILDQLAVEPSSFNDDMGRPVNCFEVVKAIANALSMRVVCYQNSIIFHDIPDYISISSTVPLGYIGHPSGDFDIANFVLGNSENINTVKVFKEAVVRFEYKGVTGLLIDGFLQNWVTAMAGMRLAQWTYSPYMLLQPDVYDRRVGNGRVEKPYGIRLYGVLAPGGEFDQIAGRTEMLFGVGDRLKLSVELEINQNVGAIEPIEAGGSDYRLEIWLTIVFYNVVNPADSRYLSVVGGAQTWEQKDLTGTTFATGDYDYNSFLPGIQPFIWAPINRQAGSQTIEIEAIPCSAILDLGRYSLV